LPEQVSMIEATARLPVPGDEGPSTAEAHPAEPPAASPGAPAGASLAANPAMDREFIARHQIIERYLSGSLPIKGATDFERFCREQPDLLDEIGLPERVNAGLRLLEAAGKPEPWQQQAKPFWGKPQSLLGLCAAVLLLAISLVIVGGASADKTRTIAKLKSLIAEQPLEPASTTQTIHVAPARTGNSNAVAATIGGGTSAQLADLRIDMARSPYRAFRVTITRVGEGRVAILHNVMKDSNGDLHLAFNTSALGPGTYQFAIDGLTWRGDPEPDSSVTIAVRH
jgi:hypothetical protein